MTSTTHTLSQAARLSPWLIVLAALSWGTITVSTNAIYQLTPAANAPSIGFWRMLFSVPVLSVLAWRAVGRRLFQVAPRDLRLIGLIGLAMAAYQVCLFGAIPRLGVTVAVIITICSAPVMVGVLAALFLNERLTARVGLALVLAIVGTALLSGLTELASGARVGDLAGVTLALGAGLSYALVTLSGRALAGRYPALQTIGLGFTASAGLLLPFALVNGFVTAFPAAGWGLLLYLGVVPTALAYWLYVEGLKHTPATTASLIALLEPLSASALAALFFGERLEPAGWLGAALLLGAMGVLLGRKT
jgi:DME family drug/metabolite transporter